MCDEEIFQDDADLLDAAREVFGGLVVSAQSQQLHESEGKGHWDQSYGRRQKGTVNLDAESIRLGFLDGLKVRVVGFSASEWATVSLVEEHNLLTGKAVG